MVQVALVLVPVLVQVLVLVLVLLLLVLERCLFISESSFSHSPLA